jgi:hypothetical protein
VNKILNNNKLISKGIHYIQYRCRLRGGGKTIWYKDVDIKKMNSGLNAALKSLEIVKKIHKSDGSNMMKYLEMINEVSIMGVNAINKIEKLPENADKRQKNFIKNSRMTMRIMKGICDDIKEEKEVKKEAEEIIKEIARKAEAPWETEKFEDKNHSWEYKIGYCSLENGVNIEQRCWPYRGFTIDWIEDIRMLFWRLEHPYLWWCDFHSTFKRLEEAEKDVSKWENKEKREKELQAIDIYRRNIGEDFEDKLTEDHDELEQVKNECREIIQYIHYKIDPSIEYYIEKMDI